MRDRARRFGRAATVVAAAAGLTLGLTAGAVGATNGDGQADVAAPVLAVVPVTAHPVVAVRDATGARSSTPVAVTCTAESSVTWQWQLTNGTGAVVRTWNGGDAGTAVDEASCDAGRALIWINGTTSAGLALPEGSYALTVAATDSGGRRASVAVPVIIDDRVPATASITTAGLPAGHGQLTMTPSAETSVQSAQAFVARCDPPPAWWSALRPPGARASASPRMCATSPTGRG